MGDKEWALHGEKCLKTNTIELNQYLPHNLFFWILKNVFPFPLPWSCGQMHCWSMTPYFHSEFDLRPLNMDDNGYRCLGIPCHPKCHDK